MHRDERSGSVGVMSRSNRSAIILPTQEKVLIRTQANGTAYAEDCVVNGKVSL